MKRFNFNQTEEELIFISDIESTYSYNENKDVKFISNDFDNIIVHESIAKSKKMIEFEYIGDIGFSKNG